MPGMPEAQSAQRVNKSPQHRTWIVTVGTEMLSTWASEAVPAPLALVVYGRRVRPLCVVRALATVPADMTISHDREFAQSSERPLDPAGYCILASV